MVFDRPVEAKQILLSSAAGIALPAHDVKDWGPRHAIVVFLDSPARCHQHKSEFLARAGSLRHSFPPTLRRWPCSALWSGGFNAAARELGVAKDTAHRPDEVVNRRLCDPVTVVDPVSTRDPPYVGGVASASRISETSNTVFVTGGTAWLGTGSSRLRARAPMRPTTSKIAPARMKQRAIKGRCVAKISIIIPTAILVLTHHRHPSMPYSTRKAPVRIMTPRSFGSVQDPQGTAGDPQSHAYGPFHGIARWSWQTQPVPMQRAQR